jgi:hypothetical protein
MRGIIGGRGDVTVDARTRVNCAVQSYYRVPQRTSHTLQNRDCQGVEALRTRLIEATVEALAATGHPRLGASRSWP